MPSPTIDLKDVVALLSGMAPEQRAGIEQLARQVYAQRPWIPNPGDQQAVVDSSADEIFAGGEPGGGKALSLDTMIPTPAGWSTMGDLRVGGRVFDDRGSVCAVVAKSPVMIGRPCYRVRFSDGEEVIADADHLWVTTTVADREAALKLNPEWRARRRAARPSRAKLNSKAPWVQKLLAQRNAARVYEYKLPGAPTAKTTEAIAATLVAKGKLNHCIPVAGALDLPAADLPLDPYVLGAWLGDGKSSGGAIYSADQEVVDQFVAAGFVRTSGSYGPYGHGFYGLMVAVRSTGALGNKHIPDVYLRASLDQRLALLQGLMDTDGTVNDRGQCEFSVVSDRLAFGFLELVRSLGAKATCRAGPAMLYGKHCGTRYRIKFMLDRPACRLSRKLAAQKIKGFRPTVGLRYIEAVERVESVPVQCIQVDSPSRLFLCGHGMIPTHNSALAIGLALTEHTNSVVFRREFPQLKGLVEEAARILKTRDGYNSTEHFWRIPGEPKGRTLEFGAVQHEKDLEKWQGRAHDGKFFDEITHFTRLQYRYLTLWNRTTKEGQRCRIICTGNPPRRPEGFWVIEHWAPWLHPNYHDPAEPGELRWAVWADDERDKELFFATQEEAIAHLETLADPGRNPETGEIEPPRSRTFLPLKLSGNLDLVRSGYASVLAAAPKELRSLASGKFEETLPDDPDQLIPTAWIQAAFDRWTPTPPPGAPMGAIGVDVGAGGPDNTVLAPRYDWWYAPLIVVPGSKTPLPSDVAALIVKHRRDNAIPIIDCGGGYGGGVVDWLTKQSGIAAVKYLGGSGGIGRSRCRTYGFHNKRAQTYWRFREALDPDQKGGSPIALPPDPELKSDLAAVRYEITHKNEVLIEDKDQIKKRIMRSPDRGDAVVEAWDEGQIALKRSTMGGGGAAPNGLIAAYQGKLQSRVNQDRTPSRYDRHARRNGGSSNSNGGEQG